MNTPSLTQYPIWQTLINHQASLRASHMRNLFKENPNRFNDFSLASSGLFLDYSKNIITTETISLLVELAKQAHVPEAISGLFRGDIVNNSEDQPALHTALRTQRSEPILVNGRDVLPDIQKTLNRMSDFVNKIHGHQWLGYSGKAIEHVVHIGIGGSFLGPKLASEALRPYWQHNIKCHYLANIDGSHFFEIIQKINPETTLFIVASKSFGTQETSKNAVAAKQWLMEKSDGKANLNQHFVAVTTNAKAAGEFGIHEDNIFPIWDWVGGRYSMWSAIGLPIALTIGMDNFNALRAGAAQMDDHFQNAPLDINMPVLLAMLGVWYINAWHADAQAILPYDHYLRGLPAHLQQLEMESNGKSVTRTGEKINYATGAIIWGGVGANGQHAYHQLLHQGNHLLPADFIVPINSHHPVNDHHAILYANCLSQSQALMQGKNEAEIREELMAKGLSEAKIKELIPHKIIPGNRPSNTIVMEKITPHTLGALIALYEHKVFVQGVIWGINSFDQWGVELGKQLSHRVYDQLSDTNLALDQDASTNGLITLYRHKTH
jgi:glucose-6-phosphate isomerase